MLPLWQTSPNLADVIAKIRFMSAITSPHISRMCQIDRFFSIVHENWTINQHPTLIAAYALWRLNWIHPFVEGNGRTARAACYYLLCMRQNKLLLGKKTVPERIKED